jgi:hypothetical protein
MQRAMRRKTNAIDDRRWAAVAQEMQPGESRDLNTPCNYVFSDSAPELGTVLMSDRALYMHAEADGAVARIAFPDLQEVAALERHLIGIRFTNRYGEETSQVISLYPSPISDLFRDRLIEKSSGER